MDQKRIPKESFKIDLYFRMTDVNETDSDLEVKCRKNVIDLRYVVNNVDNMHELSASEVQQGFPPKINVSGTDIRAKEVILVLMALTLLICSICLFFKHWKKNYRDINQVFLHFILHHSWKFGCSRLHILLRRRIFNDLVFMSKYST